jgi:flagellar biogenesis protein FliO
MKKRSIIFFLMFFLTWCVFSGGAAQIPEKTILAPNEVSGPPSNPEAPLGPPPLIPEPYLDNVSTGSPLSNDHFYAEFFKMLMMLGLIIVLLLLASWFLKRLMNSRVQQVNNASPVKIIERRALTAKTTIYVMDILGRKIAIAEAQNGVTFLGDVSRGISQQPIEFPPLQNEESREPTHQPRSNF